MDENTPLISVIVTTYNREELCRMTIQSIVEQTYNNIEVIVIDNYSDYDFNKMISTFHDDRIKPYLNKNNGVISVNRNFGISVAKGEYIAFCDDDDLWLPNKLEKQYHFLFNHKSIFAVCTNFMSFPVGRKNELFIYTTKIIGFDLYKKKRKGISTSSILLRKKIFEYVGVFDVDTNLIAVEDFDLWLRILDYQDYSIAILPDILFKYRIHLSNMSDSSNRSLSYHEKLMYVFKKHPIRCKDLIEYYEKNLSKLIEIRRIKELFYANKLNLTDLLHLKTIGIGVKLSIVVKKIILRSLIKKVN